MLKRYPLVIYKGVAGFVLDTSTNNNTDLLYVRTKDQTKYVARNQRDLIYIGEGESDENYLTLFNLITGDNWTTERPDFGMYWYTDGDLDGMVPVAMFDGISHIIGESGTMPHDEAGELPGMWLKIEEPTAFPQMGN